MSAGDINMYNMLMDEMDKISTYLPNSVVFIDDGFADILHWLGGAEMLLTYGVEAIKKFSSFEGGSGEDKKAVVFISTPYKEDEEETMNDIISNSSFENVIIFTNVHPAIQSVVRFKPVNDEEVTDILEKIKRNIKTKINNKTGKPGTADFHFITLPYSPIIQSNLFITPSHSSFFPLTPYQVHLLNFRNRISTRSTEAPKVDFEQLPKEMQLQYKLLVSTLNSTLDNLRLDEEIFSIGTSSSIIADELASLSWRDGRRPAKQKASLLLIDRVLDLATPSYHFYESPLDKIFSSLPPTNIHDVLIDLSMVYTPPTYHVVDLEIEDKIYGNLSQASDQKSSSLLKSMLLLKQKELTSHLNRALTAIVTKEKLGDPNGKHKGIGIDGLVKNISLLKNNIEVIKKNSGLIQLILAFIQSAKSHKSLDKLQKLERLAQQLMICDDEDNQCLPLKVATEFLNMKKAGPSDHFPLESLFTLLLHIFSLNNVNMNMRQQETLEDLLSNELTKESQSATSEGLIKWDEICTGKESESRLVVQEVMSQFKWLSHARLPFKNYNSLISKDDMTSIGGHQPIIKQILNDITNPDSQLPDIRRRSTGLGDILKSGFGFLMGGTQKEAHPLDHPVLLVFVVGGVTMGEVKMVVDHFVGKKYNGQVLVGSTTILTPEKLTTLTLFNDQSCLL